MSHLNLIDMLDENSIAALTKAVQSAANFAKLELFIRQQEIIKMTACSVLECNLDDLNLAMRFESNDLSDEEIDHIPNIDLNQLNALAQNFKKLCRDLIFKLSNNDKYIEILKVLINKIRVGKIIIENEIKVLDKNLAHPGVNRAEIETQKGILKQVLTDTSTSFKTKTLNNFQSSLEKTSQGIEEGAYLLKPHHMSNIFHDYDAIIRERVYGPLKSHDSTKNILAKLMQWFGDTFYLGARGALLSVFSSVSTVFELAEKKARAAEARLSQDRIKLGLRNSTCAD